MNSISFIKFRHKKSDKIVKCIQITDKLQETSVSHLLSILRQLL